MGLAGWELWLTASAQHLKQRLILPMVDPGKDQNSKVEVQCQCMLFSHHDKVERLLSQTILNWEASEGLYRDNQV
jgi:hypothetical protein